MNEPLLLGFRNIEDEQRPVIRTARRYLGNSQVDFVLRSIPLLLRQGKLSLSTSSTDHDHRPWRAIRRIKLPLIFHSLPLSRKQTLLSIRQMLSSSLDICRQKSLIICLTRILWVFESVLSKLLDLKAMFDHLQRNVTTVLNLKSTVQRENVSEKKNICYELRKVYNRSCRYLPLKKNYV